MPKPPNAARERASKACVRCHKRKLKCDALQSNGPCSRCRMDFVDGCELLGASLRGRYVRKRHHRRRSDQGSSQDEERQQSLEISGASVDGEASNIGKKDPYIEHTDGQTRQQSVSSTFGDFTEGDGHNGDKAAAQLSMLLLGENSPLTFALKGSNQSHPLGFHGTAVQRSKSTLSDDYARDCHPMHCSLLDIDYLAAKGAFTPPPPGLQGKLVNAFVERFCPLYSIVDEEETLTLHRTSTLPYILLHAICLIGATFCDISVIHEFGFKTRLQARKSFYEKAKAMFDLEYERDRIVLLQTVIMLSFWGPHVESSWNPCSWIGFGVTIAASLGMHKARSASQATGKDQGLIKRIWWTLLVRDAYCAALMGRPARIDLSQCDAGSLSLSDFGDLDGSDTQHALYQIEVTKLSMIVRQIIAKCPLVDGHVTRPSDLYRMLNQWQAHLPLAVTFDSCETEHRNIFATSLKLLFHYHILVIHLKWPDHELHGSEYEPSLATPATTIADASAQVLSASASTLSRERIIEHLPAEVFTGFFMAGIVFHRQLQKPDDFGSPRVRASLNSCQRLLNEAHEIFDPTRWVARIFDFLFSSMGTGTAPEAAAEQHHESEGQVAAGLPGQDLSRTTDSFNETATLADDKCDLFAADWQAAPHDDIWAGYSDTWILPDLLSAM